jgi:predicted ATPase
MALSIKDIHFQNGTSLSFSPITVIVGANNSGKTRLLKEINDYIQGKAPLDLKILKEMTSEPGDLDAILESLEINKSELQSGPITYTYHGGYFGTINQGTNKEFMETMKKDTIKFGPMQAINFRTTFGKACVALIQTEDRLTAAKALDVNRDPEKKSLLSSFYNKGSEFEAEVSALINQVFELNIKLDFSTPNKLSIRVSEDFSNMPVDPRDARLPMQKLQLLEEQGDGIRSFATTILLLRLTRIPCILIDEPDAFLHPPQSADLGRILAEIAEPNQLLILSTHSADLLRGLISARSDVSIVRLSRNEYGTAANILDTKEIQNILKTPLLNSTKVLDSLFYQGVVIVEGDSDRVFYEKLATQHFPSDEINYTHAHNKQTIYKLIGPYVKANVKFVAILDFDVLRNLEDLTNLIVATGNNSLVTKIQALQKEVQSEVNSGSLITKYEQVKSSLRTRMEKEDHLESINQIAGDKKYSMKAISGVLLRSLVERH